MDAYMILLRDRADKYQQAGKYRWVSFYYMPSFFIHLGKNHVLVTQINQAKPFVRPFITPDVSVSINESDYILMPMCNSDNIHFILLIFTKKNNGKSRSPTLFMTIHHT